MSTRIRIAALTTVAAAMALSMRPATLAAQDTKPDSAKPAPAPAAAPKQTLDFSGVLYGNFQYQGAKGASKGQNKFDLERAYLTFKMGISDRTSVRVTADVFQQATTGSDAYYKGWALRAKYAYLQYDFYKGPSASASARFGIVQNMVIDYEEQYWPRWISKTALDRAGFFSSADVGASTIVSLPGKFGELYAEVVNGSGYESRETDRFKDYAARMAFTPLANEGGFFKTLAIVPWFYRGATASKFVAGGTGQIGPVPNGLGRNRYGVFIAERDPRLTLGFDYAQRKEDSETGSNTTVDPRVVGDSTGRLIAAYTTIRPFQLVNAASTVPFGIVARWDQFKPNTNVDGNYNVVIGGVTWDISKRVSFSLDYQEQTPHNGLVMAPAKTYFMHWVANF